MRSKEVRKKKNEHVGLTGVGARQVVPRVDLFDDVLVDLRPFALCVTPGMHKLYGETDNKYKSRDRS